MSEQVTRKRLCDLCGEEIPQRVLYMAAGVYGVDAHTKCFDILTPRELLKFLGLDDVELTTDDPNEENTINRTRAYAPLPTPGQIEARIEERR